MVDAALAQGDNDGAGRFYTELGTRLHESDQEPGEPMLVEAAAAAGVSHLLDSLDDPALATAAAGSLADALRLAGPGIGSPVLHLDGAERGTCGPIVSPSPTGEEAGRLWDAVAALSAIGSFFELKRGRADPPKFRPG